MNKISQLINISSFLLAVFALTLTYADEYEDNKYMRREHSLTVPYQGTGLTIPYWDFYGTTMVTTSFIRLTPDLQSKRGGLFNNNPIWFRNWEIEVDFKVSGKGKELFGDGFAFWYVKEPLRSGSIFGGPDYFSGLGIFFDTYANQNGAHNHGHPYISAMVNNGSLQYDHDRDGTHTELAGCESKFRGLSHKTRVLIRYENDVLTVLTAIENDQEDFEQCFQVNGVTLPTGYHIGFSAATGDLSDNHDIISIKTFEIASKDTQGKADEDRSKLIPAAEIFAAPREHIDDPSPPMSNIKFFFIVLLCIIVIIALVIGGIYIYQKQQETSRKRFY